MLLSLAGSAGGSVGAPALPAAKTRHSAAAPSPVKPVLHHLSWGPGPRRVVLGLQLLPHPALLEGLWDSGQDLIQWACGEDRMGRGCGPS